MNKSQYFRTESIMKCSKGIKFFYSGKERNLLCSFVANQITD